jgi:hypothetical protein
MYIVLVSLFLASSGYTQEKKGEEIAITGEIIDLKCFTSGMMGGRGPEHEDCAISCIKGGLPVGIVDDEGNVYAVVPAKGMKGANDALVKYAAKRVTLKGKVLEKGGTRLLHYASVEPAK